MEYLWFIQYQRPSLSRTRNWRDYFLWRSSGSASRNLDLSFTLTEILVVGNYIFLESDQLRVGGGLGAGFYANDGGEEIGVSPRVFAQYMVTDNIGLSAQIPVNLLFVESSNFNYAGFRVGAFYRIDM